VIKTGLILSVIIAGGFFSLGQSSEELILGKWAILELKHFDSTNSIDQESTDHFWNMLDGRTLTFKANGSIEIPGYDNCSWYIKENDLFIQYSKTGRWCQDEIIQLDDGLLKLRSEVDFPEEENSQVTIYEAISE
jgi:hypothetical protein